MELKLVGSVFNEKSTMGKLFLDGNFYAYTCEDKDRNLKGDCRKKVKRRTAIDYGRFGIILSFSNNFKRFLPLLLNVPCFEGIRIHGGNSADNSEACILVGAQSDMQNRISNCASKLANLISVLKEATKKEKVFIEIVKG